MYQNHVTRYAMHVLSTMHVTTATIASTYSAMIVLDFQLVTDHQLTVTSKDQCQTRGIDPPNRNPTIQQEAGYKTTIVVVKRREIIVVVNQRKIIVVAKQRNIHQIQMLTTRPISTQQLQQLTTVRIPILSNQMISYLNYSVLQEQIPSPIQILLSFRHRANAADLIHTKTVIPDHGEKEDEKSNYFQNQSKQKWTLKQGLRRSNGTNSHGMLRSKRGSSLFCQVSK